MEVSTLLGQYSDILNFHNGPDSAEAKKFLEDNQENKKLIELAETLAWLWKKHHPQN